MANLLSGSPNQYTYYKWLYRAADVISGEKWKGYFQNRINDAENILQTINDIHGKNNLGEVSARIYAQAQKELSSELKALQSLFGVQIGVSYDPQNKAQSKEFFKEVIETFNKVLNLKENFDRNVSRIKMDLRETNTEGKLQINVASFFDTYFTKAWDERRNYREGKLMELVRNAVSNGVSEAEAIDQYFTSELETTITLAIQYMFESNRQNGTEDENKDYQKLLDVLDNFNGRTQLIEGLKQAYKIDELKDLMKKNVTKTNKQNKLKFKDLDKRKVKSMITKDHYSRGGLALEYFENYITNALLSGTIKNEGLEITVSGQSTHSGASGMKADNIITFNINPSIIEETIKSLGTDATDRANIVQKINEMEQKLSNVKDGFIIYSSAKNYTRQDKDFRGFSGGEKITLSKFESLTGQEALVAALRQVMKGAMGENGENFEAMKTGIIENLAYLLFDDFQVEGTDTGLTKLHLFDLDGIFVPFSVLLYEIASSIEELNHNPTSIISVDIERKEINDNISETATPQDIGAALRKYVGRSQQEWSKQAQDTDSMVKIGVHFFKNFFKFIQENF